MRIAMTALAVAVLAGCHTMRFELVNEEPARVVYDRKSFFLWGLVATKVVDVSVYCPGGVAAIREETRFSDGLGSLVTLGIWKPRSSWYYCLQEASTR